MAEPTSANRSARLAGRSAVNAALGARVRMASAPALSILPRFPKSLEKERFEGLRTCPERPAIDIAVQSPSTTNVEMPSPSRTKMFGAVRAFIAASLQPVSGERFYRGNSLSQDPQNGGSGKSVSLLVDPGWATTI